jgi:hypothetical protein
MRIQTHAFVLDSSSTRIWTQTQEPGPGHFGLDFDSGSGPESASTDPFPVLP